MKTFLKSLGHLAIGGATAAVMPHALDFIPMIPHIDPMTAAILGSAGSSLLSAFFNPPHKGSE